MKEKELREHAKCDLCELGIGHTGLPLFWTVKIERHGVLIDAVRRQDGLGAFLGSPALAAVMGTDEEMTKPMMAPVELTVCESCATDRGLPIAALAMGD